MQMTAFALMCSRSKSARFRTSMRRTLWSRIYDRRSFGKAIFLFRMVTFGVEELAVTPLERPDSLDGSVDLFGEGGRLLKLLFVGVIGVLEGRSMGTVKVRNGNWVAAVSPCRKSVVYGLFKEAPIPVGTDGREKGGCSSSSSIVGKA